MKIIGIDFAKNASQAESIAQWCRAFLVCRGPWLLTSPKAENTNNNKTITKR
jgi:hypothetical protein